MFVLLSSGSNAHGQLSNGSLDDSHKFGPCSFSGCPPGTMPPTVQRVVDIASGANHSLVLLETSDGVGGSQTELWGCGDGSLGQLGAAYLREIRDGEVTSVFRPIDLSLHQVGFNDYHYKFVAASWETTYIALSCVGRADILISMGADDFGDLGIGGLKKGKEIQSIKPFHIVNFGHLTIGGSAIEVDSIIIQSLASGQHHIITQIQARLTDGTDVSFVAGWGTSRHGQLGDATAPNGRAAPFISAPKIVLIDDTLHPTIAPALGSQHTAFVHASGQVSGLGSNRKGQLQGLDSIKCVESLGCTWNGTYVVVKDGQNNAHIIATGSYMHGQLGSKIRVNDSSRIEPPSPSEVEFPFPLGARQVQRIACGTEHILTLLTADLAVPDSHAEVWGWGWNEHGNLGTGKTDDAFIPIKVWPGVDKSLPVGVWAGCGTSWIYCITNK